MPSSAEKRVERSEEGECATGSSFVALASRSSPLASRSNDVHRFDSKRHSTATQPAPSPSRNRAEMAERHDDARVRRRELCKHIAEAARRDDLATLIADTLEERN